MAIDLPHSPGPDLAVPPGDFLAETLEAMGVSQTELAARTGRPVQAINEIIKGKKEITPETALELERVLGAPAHVWLNLERDYRLNRARLADLERLRQQIPRARRFPYAEMAGLGWLPETGDREQRVRELLRFFGVASLANLPFVQEAAYRKSAGKKASPEALAAWLRKGELEARAVVTQPFNAPALRAALPRMKAMTRWQPERFQPALCRLCADCGVALIFVPHLRGTYANGATRWLSGNKALVQLSIRNRYDDIFWFSFFHEVGHLLLHGKRDVFIDALDKFLSQQDPKERETDSFAADTLISAHDFAALRRLSRYTSANVRAFAEHIGLAPSIVVGRLQHEQLLPHTHLNGLRAKFELRECSVEPTQRP